MGRLGLNRCKSSPKSGHSCTCLSCSFAQSVKVTILLFCAKSDKSDKVVILAPAGVPCPILPCLPCPVPPCPTCTTVTPPVHHRDTTGTPWDTTGSLGHTGKPGMHWEAWNGPGKPGMAQGSLEWPRKPGMAQEARDGPGSPEWPEYTAWVHRLGTPPAVYCPYYPAQCTQARFPASQNLTSRY